MSNPKQIAIEAISQASNAGPSSFDGHYWLAALILGPCIVFGAIIYAKWRGDI